ncbi:serum response factor-binding protein 1 isoform X2 [Sturnira hondurensis]|uniref:serum response factor-binding protein 1 isoform X2 n=1 Tax=Sturnira hondurensis TaxID=192404 RepID=UPI00187A3FEF|nr:serum response factor-binding protein 1 isoform X2 [Sturnira hondurensis]
MAQSETLNLNNEGVLSHLKSEIKLEKQGSNEDFTATVKDVLYLLYSVNICVYYKQLTFYIIQSCKTYFLFSSNLYLGCEDEKRSEENPSSGYPKTCQECWQTEVKKVSHLKGAEDALLKNQRRAQRLLEEIHAMKELKPDIVTKSALSDDINFEKICKKPDSTATERATARLAAHPLLKKKIDVLKAAVKAFKDARQNDTEIQSSKNASEENYSKDTSGSSDDAIKLQHEGALVSEQKDKEAKMTAKKSVNSSKEKIAKMEHRPKAVDIPNSPSKPSEKDSVKDPCDPQKVPANRKTKPSYQNKRKEAPKSSLGENSEGEELPGEEKEYFDDSTEERFYNQSSVSEEDDSGDDFFIGKVRRTRKKESDCHSSVVERKSAQKVSPEKNILETHQGVRNDKNKPSTEGRKFESVFFHSLSGSESPRSYREQAPKSNMPGFQQNEPQLKNQLVKRAQRGSQNTAQQTQLPLHPSWEASRRRKEQQSKIAVFQGKKITFDD